MPGTFWSARITAAHDLSHFHCGIPELDDWLVNSALRHDSQDIARVQVWTKPHDIAVVAYYAISPTRVARAELPRSAAGGHSQIPGYLIGRLALDSSLQGQGLGVQLLIDALEAIVSASRISGGRIIVVDPVDAKAAAFYRRYGFQTTGNSDRLWLKVATARDSLAIDVQES